MYCLVITAPRTCETCNKSSWSARCPRSHMPGRGGASQPGPAMWGRCRPVPSPSSQLEGFQADGSHYGYTQPLWCPQRPSSVTQNDAEPRNFAPVDGSEVLAGHVTRRPQDASRNRQQIAQPGRWSGRRIEAGSNQQHRAAASGVIVSVASDKMRRGVSECHGAEQLPSSQNMDNGAFPWWVACPRKSTAHPCP